ncbi:MAG: phosphatase PAP2 family protein [Propionivibrio sp.]|uniref:phosphatase PAP2 family protein n=1 Tax=Propionivibrio sp. TaxID=2212460 RepID=UPI001A5C6774|nr:phosphatase PAP2 family protein [Propionivibrio sp.]MBL8413755.1 phosphatase PAP2 family protein [Propionivibrio sp.]
MASTKSWRFTAPENLSVNSKFSIRYNPGNTTLSSRSLSLIAGKQLNTAYLWSVLTHLGSTGLMMPVLVISATGLWQSFQKEAVRIWLIALALAVMVTLATKVLFFGWGFGISYLDFTGISGHTLLATSVLPVFFSWLLASEEQRISLAGAGFGLLLGAGVGVSRVALDTHTHSEVVSAWILGMAVSVLALNAMKGTIQRPWFARLSPLVLLLAFGTSTSEYLPTHDWEVKASLLLSGNSKPYTRHHLQKQAKLGQSSLGRFMAD